jgi:uncharacterized protein (DUF3820 family)
MKYDLDDTIPFGKYSGRLVEDVLTEDPQYLLWLLENTDRFQCDKVVLDAIMNAARGRS